MNRPIFAAYPVSQVDRVTVGSSADGAATPDYFIDAAPIYSSSVEYNQDQNSKGME